MRWGAARGRGARFALIPASRADEPDPFELSVPASGGGERLDPCML